MKCRSAVAVGVLVLIVGCAALDPYVFGVDWTSVDSVSRSITTLQVVSNPLLTDSCPIKDKFFQTLGALQADMVRYVPWFPYPHVAVAELEPPSANSTSWDFTYVDPEFSQFMEATHDNGHTTVINFSTQPTWLYDTTDWSYPADPAEVDWDYPKGAPVLDNIPLLADYYRRLVSWMTSAQFVDENGLTHYGGHKYQLNVWEVFNEAEHGYDVVTYTKTYDSVVAAIQEASPNHTIKFMGIGGASSDWVPYFIDHSNHNPSTTPLDWISLHFYASCSSRTDPYSYETFFSSADGFISTMVNTVLPQRNSISPSTKIDLDELGVILPDDNTPGAAIPSSSYWPAAGAMYAYLFGKLAPYGVEVFGESQLCGSPEIPEWGIPDPQYPSVSMTNWTTGEGNARYWVLRLLLEHFTPGDNFVRTTEPETEAENPFCALVNGAVSYDSALLQCSDSFAVITSIDFAAFGTPTGHCGNYSVDESCNAEGVYDYAVTNCVGKQSCEIPSYPYFGDPCYGTYKTLKVQARCSGSGGYGYPPDQATQVFAQAVTTEGTGQKKVLLVNKLYSTATVGINSGGTATTSGILYYVDETTGDTPPRSRAISDVSSFDLTPFSTSILVLYP
ncbi:Brefeldin A-inhibited guanine nucleotide-exchange protein 2 [Pelomyxa schiedti]|nr:Brefeldin A-inhibited guanine nucleotide-exchange protein 2 [Pelomyxa schiedti]